MRRRTVLSRTAKSCGPDASTPASSLRWCCEPDRVDKTFKSQATVTRKPDRRGEHDISRKPLRAGMPGDFGGPVLLVCLLLLPLHTRRRVHRAPGIPHALLGRRFLQDSDALRREIASSYLAVIARSESDEAIPLSVSRRQSWIASLRSQ